MSKLKDGNYSISLDFDEFKSVVVLLHCFSIVTEIPRF